MSEPVRRVGRGGAGNYYTQSDIKTVVKQHEDVEAQKLDSPDDASHKPPLSSTISPTTALHTGRGGAGNYIAPSDIDESDPSGQSIIAKTKEAVTHTKEKVMEKLSSKSSGYGGRGGAGNYRPSAEEELKERERQEEGVRRGIREQVEGDVETGLSKPPGAYVGTDREKWSPN